MTKRILGIDFGDRSIGLAVSDPLGLTAQALGRYMANTKKEDAKYFQDLIAQYGVCEIVVGLPLKMDGTPGKRAQKTRTFGSWLEQTVGRPVVYWDERLTTQQALRILRQQKNQARKHRKYKDQVSATIILASYLESRR